VRPEDDEAENAEKYLEFTDEARPAAFAARWRSLDAVDNILYLLLFFVLGINIVF